MNEKIALFPGSFDPFTVGHQSIVERGLRLFDKIIIAIGINEAKHKCLFPSEKRATMIGHLFKDEPRVQVECYDTLTAEFARKMRADFILRGIRTVADFEYEKTIADINRSLTGVETVVLFTEPRFAAVSSTIVRELLGYGQDVTSFIPKGMEF